MSRVRLGPLKRFLKNKNDIDLKALIYLTDWLGMELTIGVARKVQPADLGLSTPPPTVKEPET